MTGVASFVLILLVSGNPVYVSLKGSPPLPDIRELGFAAMIVTDSSMADLQEGLMKWYLDEGYPFASAGFYFSSEDTLVVNVVPGRHALLEEIRIEGMPGTRPRVFTRLMPRGLGEPFSREVLEEWLRRIGKLPFVAAVGSTELLLGPRGNLVVVQHLVKGKQGHFTASLDWKGESLEGMGEVRLLNLAGTARKLGISGKTVAWGGFDAHLDYLEPWIFGTPVSLFLVMSQETPESAWVNREGSLEGILDLGRVSVSMGAGAWRGFPPGGAREKYDYGSAGMGYDAKKKVPQGSGGLDVALRCRAGRRMEADSTGVLSMAHLSFDYRFYQGVLGAGGSVSGGGVLQGDCFTGLMDRLGGQSTLRGYPENAFRAKMHVLARPELSLGETETRIYVFTDAAILKNEENEILRPVGVGIGMRGASGVFDADVSAGFPLEEGIGGARVYLELTASI